MANSNDKLGGYIVVAIAAFAIGRCSDSDPSPPQTVSPQALLSAPAEDTPSGEALTEPVPQETSTPIEPQQFIANPVEAEEPEAATERSVYYARCADARADGAAPIHVGEPGYAGHLDRDGDGVACE